MLTATHNRALIPGAHSARPKPQPQTYTCETCRAEFSVAEAPPESARYRCQRQSCRMPFWEQDRLASARLGIDPRTAAARSGEVQS